MAYRLNTPVTAITGLAGELASFARVDCKNVMIEAVKQAQNGSGTVIRLYECFGQRNRVRLELGWEPGEVHRVSLMEDFQERVRPAGNMIEFEIRPYEIASFIVQ